MTGRELAFAFAYLIAGAVMLGVMIVLVVLGHLLLAGLACLAAVAAVLGAVGLLVADGEDHDH
jgi:hypothetical protein